MADSKDTITFDFSAGDDLVKVFDALSHPMRIRIMGILYEKRQHVSELARIVNISRPLLYMHLQKLEVAKLVNSKLEISEDGKAMKFYSVSQFDLQVTPGSLFQASKGISTESRR